MNELFVVFVAVLSILIFLLSLFIEFRVMKILAMLLELTKTSVALVEDYRKTLIKVINLLDEAMQKAKKVNTTDKSNGGN